MVESYGMPHAPLKNECCKIMKLFFGTPISRDREKENFWHILV